MTEPAIKDISGSLTGLNLTPMSSDLTPRRRGLVFCACIAAIFTSAVEGTIVATAMPTIVADLGGFSLLGWVFAAYMLTQAVTIPIYGRLADLYGRRRILLIGLSIFILGCVLCGFAPSMLMLVLFRAVQGLGAGAVMPVTLTIVGDAYPALERVRVQPYIASVFAGSSIVGPVLGAFIVGNMSWQFIFWFNVPIGIIAAVMLMAFLQEKPRVVKHTIDITGAALLMAAITVLLLAMLEASSLGWWIIALLAFSVLLFFLFVRQETRSPEPLLPAALWRNRTLLISNIGSFAIGASIMGVTAYLPTYMQGVMGQTVLVAGVALSIMSFSWPMGSVIGSRIMIRTTYRTSATTGGVVLVLGSTLLAVLASSSHETRMNALGGWWPAVAVFLMGGGLGFLNSSLHISMQEVAGGQARGIATATVAFMRMAGATFGTAILGAVLNLGLALKLPHMRDPMQMIMDPVQRAQYSAADLAQMTDTIGSVLSYLFWVTFIIAMTAAIIARFTPAIRPGSLAVLPSRNGVE